MIFISLNKWKKAPTKDMKISIDQVTKKFENLEKQGIKIRVYWTLGRYDAITIMEAPTEKEAMKTLLSFQDVVETETLIAIPREEAIKLL